MSNIPKLRFPEFTDAWEKCKLGKIAIKVTEKNKDGIFQETLTNSAEFGVISQRDFFDKDISNPENLNGYYIVKPNDFVYNPRISNLAPVGPIKRNQLNRIGIMSPLYFIFRVSSNIDLDFLDSFFSTNLWHLFMKLNGDSGARADRIAIKDKIFMEMPISFPTLSEQQKIGNLFKQLDRLITLHKRKWDDVILLKKALLQKMFPKNGSDFPEIRFPEFTDAWEKCKVGDFLEESRIEGTNGKIAKKLTVKLWGKGVIEKPEIYQGSQATNYYIRKVGQFIYGKLDFLNQAFGIIPAHLDGYESTLDSPAFDLSKNLNSDFFLYYVCRENFYLYQGIIANGSRKAKRIHTETFFNMPLILPSSFSEQQKIGNLFKQLDRLITLHKRQHEHYQLLKKALLQQMFV
ncbi:restriction endonuclease subunit S [Gallibacterium anatis]|uniref:restriction endonuclease subunit S n=1 Tax=Gallibacterium anatis TaxID=750 RepID=UPI000BA01E42|nr:restriction endonuclease subunit S [Gallibacterium anatis]WAX71370.1 restriction endonuclease subunit S [Gallibacterium anatis]